MDARFQPVDVSDFPRFADLATFFRLPRTAVSADLDIAILGAPFDLGVNFQSGARNGPAAVREATRGIRRCHPTSNVMPFQECNIADVGDAKVNPYDLLGSLQYLQDLVNKVHAAGARPLTVGGDHTIPLPILRAIAKDRPVGLIQFDAHPDLHDEVFGSKINHGTSFRRALDEGLIDPKRSIQIGLRGSRFSEDDLAYGVEVGMRVITYDEYEALGRQKVCDELVSIAAKGPAYVSFDIDALDPIYARGTGTPEVGGLSVRDCQVLLRALNGLDIVGADICEVAPGLDVTGLTQLNAANLLFELVCVLTAAVKAAKER